MNEVYVINSLIPFDMLIDIDLGLIRLIREKFYDPNVFLTGILDSDEESIKYYLLTRPVRNPLYIIMKDDSNTKLMDSLYNQFIEQEYDKILELSPTTGIFELPIASSTVPHAVKFSILCNSKKELDEYMKREGNITNAIIESDLSKVNIDNFDNIYIKNYEDIKKYNNLKRKNIYIGDYLFNKTKDPSTGKYVPLVDISIEMIPQNNIKFIGIHPIDINEIPL